MSAPAAAAAAPSSHEAGRALLYTFSGSVWGSVPRIGLIEKGYASSDVELRSVDLLKGENFAPTYLRVNSAGTVPTLVVPLAETTGREQDTKFRALTDSVAVLNFLDASRSQQLLSQKKDSAADAVAPAPAPALAPATIEGKAASDALIALVHCAEADPNFLLLCARSAEELKAQAGGLQGAFVKGRDEALQRYRAEAAANADTVNPREASQNTKLLAFYDDKIAAQAPLVGAYLKQDPAAVAGFVEASRKAWGALPGTLAKLEAQLQGTYALGDQFSLADVHVMAWLARLLAVVKGLPGAPDDELAALDAALKHEVCGGHAVGPKLAAYWKTLKTRPSFTAVYGDGLH